MEQIINLINQLFLKLSSKIFIINKKRNIIISK